MDKIKKNKFNFSEVVEIHSNIESFNKFNGKKAVIRGISEGDGEPKVYAYAVNVLNGDEYLDSIFIFEEDLKHTGDKINDKHQFYTGESIKVRVNPETGEGEIIEE